MSTFTSLSLRERIIREVVRRFETQREGLPTGTTALGEPAPYDFAWDVVIRQPLTEDEKRKRYALAVIDPAEVKEFQIHTFRARLNLELRFHVLAGQVLSRGEDVSQVANMILLNIERRVMEDIQLGEGGSSVATDKLADQVILVGSELDIDSFQDRKIEGAVFVDVLYKHVHGDPRRRV